jgi:predicted Rossmann fold nucleotide-binding protein DprA/Smf involved in DNA uptake
VKIGFTGSRRLDLSHKDVVAEVLDTLTPDKDELVVGGADGADIIIAQMAIRRGFKVHAVLPQASFHPHARHYSTSFEYAAMGHNDTDSYMNRNDLLVLRSDRLIAFPDTAYPSRSGTWATIRRARKAGKHVELHPLHDVKRQEASAP